MQARMPNPAVIHHDAMKALLALHQSTQGKGISDALLHLIDLRVSQINGCSLCVDMHARECRQAGETDERLFAVAVWREAPWFTEAERAALELAEAVTRIADRGDAVSDEVWSRARAHYDEAALASLLIAIANINVWNRLNVATRQPAGQRVS